MTHPRDVSMHKTSLLITPPEFESLSSSARIEISNCTLMRKTNLINTKYNTQFAFYLNNGGCDELTFEALLHLFGAPFFKIYLKLMVTPF